MNVPMSGIFLARWKFQTRNNPTMMSMKAMEKATSQGFSPWEMASGITDSFPSGGKK